MPHGVEPICKALAIARPPTMIAWRSVLIPAGCRIAPGAICAPRPEIEPVFQENWHVYGLSKVWRQSDREPPDEAIRHVWDGISVPSWNNDDPRPM